jgi:hypothetical protein
MGPSARWALSSTQAIDAQFQEDMVQQNHECTSSVQVCNK